MKPGDVIEWVYKNTDRRAHSDALAFSIVTSCWVPIGGLALLIAYNDGIVTWLCGDGLFSARDKDCCWVSV